MRKNICMDKEFIIISTCTFILLIIYFYTKYIKKYSLNNEYNSNKINDNHYRQYSNETIIQKQDCPKQACPKQDCPKCSNKIIIEKEECSNNIITPDSLKEYDRQKIIDPLEPPTQRLPRHVMHPLYFNKKINIHTRGYPDNYKLIGILINTNNKNTENKFMRLFGREIYPNSSRYEYYTAVNSGGIDRIKIPIEYKKELYDGDELFIKHIGEKYKVQLYKLDTLRYNPHII